MANAASATAPRMPTMTLDEARALPALIGVKDASRLSGIHPRTVETYCKRGEWRAVRIANRWRINTAWLVETLGLADEIARASSVPA